MSRIKKIFHIHTDLKFIHDSNRFEDDEFENKIIFIGVKRSDISIPKEIDYSFEKLEINQINQIIKDADVLVLYGLCEIKKRILKSKKGKAIVLWRFFGYELYGTRKDLMYCQENLSFLEHKSKLFHFIRSIKRKFESLKLNLLLKRIDYILLFNNEEYEFMKKYWRVPPLMLMNIRREDMIKNTPQKKNQIIVGNSGSPYNNHLEIIEIIKELPNNSNDFLFFFSYGYGSKQYKDLVSSRIAQINNGKLIENFLTIEEFNELYDESAALIINSYRQLALANIFSALKRGVKVYLNSKNVVKEWLSNEGFMVFSINDFISDIKNNKIYLSPSEIEHNKEMVIKLQNKITKDVFLNQLKKHII